MKKLVVAAVAIGLLGGALAIPADAKKKPRKPKKVEREIEGSYANPAIGVPGVVGSAAAGGAVEFPIGTKESFLTLEIEDTSGSPVVATLSQDTDPATPTWEIFATICGGVEDLAIEPGIPLRVSVYTSPGPDQPTCTGPALGGTISGVVSNLP